MLSGNSDAGSLDVIGRSMAYLEDLFVVVYGHSLELNGLVQVEDGVNFVSRTSKNNGVSARVAPLKDIEPAPAGLISVVCG